MIVKDKISLKVPWGRMGGIFFCVCILFSTLFTKEAFAKEAPPTPGTLHALSAVLYDGESGRILYGKDEEIKRANASTTKIMTCILALENAKLNDMVSVTSYAATMPDVQLGIVEGEYYRMEDLLYSLMLESHNDVAVVIAEHVGGDVLGFSQMMNEKAKSLGCNQTTFFTPNGLDQKEGDSFHGTTAKDLARIMSYCVWESPQKDLFLQITQTKERAFTNYRKDNSGNYQPGDRSFQVRNHNRYLEQNAKCISGKTGFTGEAGYCYVGAVESEGRHFVVALLGCGWPNNKNYKWEDCNRLFSYGEKHFHYRKIPNVSRELDKVTLLDGANASFDFGQKVTMRPYVKECDKQVLLSDWDGIDITVDYPKSVIATKKGVKQIGSLKVCVGNTTILKRNILVKCPVGRRNLAWYFQGVLRVFAGCAGGN